MVRLCWTIQPVIASTRLSEKVANARGKLESAKKYDAVFLWPQRKVVNSQCFASAALSARV